MKPVKGLALARSCGLLWSQTKIQLPVIFVNALIQGLLVMSRDSNTSGALNIVLAVLSAAVLILAAGLVLAGLQQMPAKPISWRTALTTLKGHSLRFAVWAVALVVVAQFAFSWWIWPGVIVLAATPYLLIATLSDEANSLAANLRAIAAHPLRWLALSLLVVIFGTLAYLLSAVTVFFVRGFAASALVWFVAGYLGAWVMGAFSLLFKSYLGKRNE